jgi:hypothetical protein
MKVNNNWTRVVYILGLIALCICAIDPMEGSVGILIGSILVALSSFLAKDRHWKIFMYSALAIIVGVFFLWLFSWFGGIGEKSQYSSWWIITMLPYPAGWLTIITVLIIRIFKKPIQKDIS